MSPEPAGLVLAAGAGTRLGQPKALVRLAGETLLDRAVRVLESGGCKPVVTVVGAAAEEVRVAAPRVSLVENPHWSTGMASSLRVGLETLGAEIPAVVVALVDQPHVGPDVVAALVAAWRSGAAAAVASYGGRPRNPVLLDRSVWDDVVASVTGDAGARDWLRAHPETVTLVNCDHLGHHRDIDTPADLEAARFELEARA